MRVSSEKSEPLKQAEDNTKVQAVRDTAKLHIKGCNRSGVVHCSGVHTLLDCSTVNTLAGLMLCAY